MYPSHKLNKFMNVRPQTSVITFRCIDSYGYFKEGSIYKALRVNSRFERVKFFGFSYFPYQLEQLIFDGFLEEVL